MRKLLASLMLVAVAAFAVVDDQFAPLADKIQVALKSQGITDKPVRFVINTHYHGDHAGWNAPFSSARSTVIAQDNVRKR